ncbi:MAG: hypothetical protein RIT40_98 [Planctomycetota bacterium]
MTRPRMLAAIVAAATIASSEAPAFVRSAMGEARPSGTAVIVALPQEAAWQDFAFLAAVAASHKANDGVPLVIASAADGALRPEAQDFLARRTPESVVVLAETDADSTACALSKRFFTRSQSVVVCSSNDYSGALVAAVLAARERAPLLYSSGATLEEPVRAELVRLGTTKVLYVGASAADYADLNGVTAERLPKALDVAHWMQAHGRTIDYLAVAAPADRTNGHRRKLSLSAAALAAGRNGAVVLLGNEDRGPESFEAARAGIESCRSLLGNGLEYLCVAAAPEIVPMAVLPGSGVGIDTDPPSDLEYGNIDADPFVELAVGRFVAEDAAAGALLAARSLSYEQLLAPEFARTMAMAEWERVWTPLFANLGFTASARHEGGKPIQQESPLATAAAVVHSAHSSWLQLGETYTHDSQVLLAPCLVETGGCSPAALDSDPEQRSVALRLLRNGAIGFVGSVRRAVAQHELYRTEFWNAVLAGKSLGQANRHALNRALVACLARDEEARGVLRYQLHNAAFYGDPALVLHLPSKPRTRGASVEVRGGDITVRGPSEWMRVEPFAPPDWNYDASPTIYSWRGAGVGVESSWDAQFRRNREVLMYTAEVRTERKVSGLKASAPLPSPLAWDGRWFLDEHADGSRSVYFRVQLIDFDMSTGKVREKAERLRFRME